MAEYFAGGHLRFISGEWRDDNGDVVEIIRVRNGRWEAYQVPPIMCCSVCDWGTSIQSDFKYCPNCGAKMDLEE